MPQCTPTQHNNKKIIKEIKNFQDIHKLKEFMTTKPALQKILKGIIYIEEEDKCNQENKRKNKSH
jgi:hypothetical protein